MPRGKRVLVVGGEGYLGRRATAAMKRAGLDVTVASRSAALRVDLGDTTSFAAVEAFDVVVDLADATRFAPDALAAHCLAKGLVFVEATSDAAAIVRMTKRFGGEPEPGSGTIVLGAGIFTGLSNLLGAAAARAVESPQSLTLAIRSSPFSGAGVSTVALMSKALSRRAMSAKGGELVLHAPVSRGPAIDFPSGSQPTLRASFAEQVMLPVSTHVPNVEVYFSPAPSFLSALFTMIPSFIATSRWYAALMGLYFTLLRRFVLRGRPSRVELWARAEADDQSRTLTLQTADGMAAGGAAIGAIVERLLSTTLEPGLSYVDEICELDPIVERSNELSAESAILVGR